MVGGMSKSGEPRRGQALRTKGSSSLTKPQPPPEALQMARILGDHSPTDISDIVQQVRAVVPGRSEEEICIALHDNDFDPEIAISALLDSEAQGEWTRQEPRSRKKGHEIDLVIGDTKLRQAGVRTLGTTKTATSRGGTVGKTRSQPSARVRSSRRGERIRPPRRVREQPNKPASSQNEPGSADRGVIIAESWDIDVAEPPQQHIDTESWGEHWDVQPELVERWQRDSPVFPEAIPPSHQFIPVASTAEVTTSTVTTTSPDRYQTTPLEHRPLEAFVLEQPLKPPSKVKHKRIARSEIPTKPVEMPDGSIDVLDVEFGSLGIDFFVGAETEPPVSEITPPTAAISTSAELTTTTKLEDVTPLLTVQHFTDDPGVIGATLDPYPETKAPPGLTHPNENQEKPPLLPPEPISHSESTMPTLPPIPQSIELPRPTPETLADTTVEQPTPQLTPHIFTPPVASTTTSLLLTATQTHTTLTASTGTRASQSQHTSQQGKHGQPHPSMLAYQMMTPQYFMPMSYYGDPSEMSRYQSVYYQQHPGASSDLSSAAATGITRDHSTLETSKFPGRADVTTPNTPQQTQQGGLQQGQQIGPAFVNPAYPYSQMLYPGWYHTAAMGMAGFSAAASMGPKASTSYPGVSTYQATSPGAFGMQAAYDETGGHEFPPRMYPGSSMPKSSGIPSTSGMSDLSNATFKHQQFDKSGSNYYQMGTSAGGYMGGFMQMPPMHHLPVVPPHDNTQTRGQMQKHSKPSYGGLTWPQGT